MIEFTVYGEAAPQGSKVKTKFGMREDNPRTKPWRDQVAQEAGLAMRARGFGTFSGAMMLTVTAYYPRPAGHYGTGRNAGVLKASAPTHKITKPDGDKLLRSICDACSGIIWRDDAQVVDMMICKRYVDAGGLPHALIQARPAL